MVSISIEATQPTSVGDNVTVIQIGDKISAMRTDVDEHKLLLGVNLEDPAIGQSLRKISETGWLYSTLYRNGSKKQQPDESIEMQKQIGPKEVTKEVDEIKEETIQIPAIQVTKVMNEIKDSESLVVTENLKEREQPKLTEEHRKERETEHTTELVTAAENNNIDVDDTRVRKISYQRRYTVQHSQTQEQLSAAAFLQMDSQLLSERYKKIVGVFGDKPKKSSECLNKLWQPKNPRDEADNQSGEICLDKMKAVIKRLDVEDNWFHYFMNALPVIGKGHTKEEQEDLLTELETIADDGKIPLTDFLFYTAKQITIKNEKDSQKRSLRRESWRERSLKWRNKKPPGQKLLKYFTTIAESKKIYLTPTRVFFPFLVILQLILHVVARKPITAR